MNSISGGKGQSPPNKTYMVEGNTSTKTFDRTHENVKLFDNIKKRGGYDPADNYSSNLKKHTSLTDEHCLSDKRTVNTKLKNPNHSDIKHYNCYVEKNNNNQNIIDNGLKIYSAHEHLPQTCKKNKRLEVVGVSKFPMPLTITDKSGSIESNQYVSQKFGAKLRYNTNKEVVAEMLPTHLIGTSISPFDRGNTIKLKTDHNKEKFARYQNFKAIEQIGETPNRTPGFYKSPDTYNFKEDNSKKCKCLSKRCGCLNPFEQYKTWSK